MKICLVRHGETDWNSIGRFQGRENIPLNETGIKQVQNAVSYFKASAWNEIITSPLARAKMSAEIIGREIGLTVIHEDPGLVERDYGKLSGMTKEEAKKIFPDENYEGMESLDALSNRVMDTLVKWTNKFHGKNIIIMTHGAVINSILTNLSGNKIEMGKAILKNAGITLLEKQGDTINIVSYNKEETLHPAFASPE